MRDECVREQEVLDVLAARGWPSRCDDDLRQHVASCQACADLIEVARALLELSETDVAMPAALPPASVVWWRAQLRAREDAARAAARPLRLTFRLAVACVAALAIVGIIAAAPYWSSLLPDPGAWLPVVDARATRDAALDAFAHRGVQLAAFAWIVLAPVALYFAFAKD